MNAPAKTSTLARAAPPKVRRRKRPPPPPLPHSVREREKQLGAKLGKAARLARGRAGLTQAEVADGIRIATEVYGRMERGRMLPSVPTLLRMCITLRCRPDELMGFSPEPSPQASAYRAGKLPEGLEDSPEVRRLLRHLKRLDPRKLKLLTEVTAAVL